MTKLWKADTTNWEVRAVEGTAWPDRDSEGEQIWENTHFKEERQAWDDLIRNAEAGVKLAGREVEQARDALTNAEKRAAQDAVNYAKAVRAYEASLPPNTRVNASREAASR